MLLYSKLYDLLTGRHISAGRPALRCTVKEIYGRNDKLRYVHFNTENGIPCLLYIPSKHEVKMDSKKFLSLQRWTDKEVNFEAILAADPDVSIVKEIKATSSPQGMIDLVKRLEPSLKSIPYKIGIISEEYLIVLTEDGEIDVFYASGPKETKLIIVLDIETLLFKNVIPELERVHKNVIKIIQESTLKYWDSLLDLLKKCNQMKIVTKGKHNMIGIGLLEQSVKICTSHTAIKLALECFDEQTIN
jgi:hypothetical protein